MSWTKHWCHDELIQRNSVAKRCYLQCAANRFTNPQKIIWRRLIFMKCYKAHESLNLRDIWGFLKLERQKLQNLPKLKTISLKRTPWVEPTQSRDSVLWGPRVLYSLLSKRTLKYFHLNCLMGPFQNIRDRTNVCFVFYCNYFKFRVQCMVPLKSSQDPLNFVSEVLKGSSLQNGFFGPHTFCASAIPDSNYPNF